MQHTGSRIYYLSLKKMLFWPWLPAEMLLDLIFQSVGNFSSITLQIKNKSYDEMSQQSLLRVPLTHIILVKHKKIFKLKAQL